MQEEQNLNTTSVTQVNDNKLYTQKNKLSFVDFWATRPPLIKHFRYYNERKGQALVFALTGGQHMRTGTGKSYTGLKFGQEMDRDFGMHKVVYFPKDFLDVMDYIEDRGEMSQMVLVDEGEVTAPAHLWASFTNSAIGYTLATFRYLKCNACFCSPTFAWLDKRIRFLVSHWGITEKKYDDKIEPGKKQSRVELKMYELRTNFMGDKLFAKKIKIRTADGVFRLGTINVKMPDESLAEEYEKKSRKFKQHFRAKVSKDIQKFIEMDMKDTGKTPIQVINEIKADKQIMEEITGKRGAVDKDRIKAKFPELRDREAKQVKNVIESMMGK